MRVSLAIVIALASPVASRARELAPIRSENGDVRTFYGVPVKLNLKSVGALHLPHRNGEEPGGEGKTLRTLTFHGRDNVSVKAIFDRRGDCVELKTTSRRAADPRGIRVGNTLAQVREAWPEGKLFFGRSADDPQRPFASFATGTNVILHLSTDGHDPLSSPAKTLVKEIVIKPFRVPL